MLVLFEKGYTFNGFCGHKNFPMARGSHARAKEHSSRQKRRWSLLALCGLLPFQPRHPFAPRLFAEREGKGKGKVCSRPFLASTPALLPGQQRNRSDRPTKLE